MSATDFPPRCKDKKNLANDVHCELYFLQNYAKILRTQPILAVFSIKNVCIASLYTSSKSEMMGKQKVTLFFLQGSWDPFLCPKYQLHEQYLLFRYNTI